MSNRTPSLLEPESRGGENNERGVGFQANILLTYLPGWLALDGFYQLIRESIGDTEVAIFVPGKGKSREFLEVKNHRLTPELFWTEIQRFMEVDRGSPDTYQWFTLAGPEVSDSLKPLTHALRRLRSSYGIYDLNSGVSRNSIQDYRDIVNDLGQPPEVADFLYTRVLVDTSAASAQEYGVGLFGENLRKAFPEFKDLPYSVVVSIHAALKGLMDPINTPITRREIEAAIQANIPDQYLPPHFPVRLFTADQHNFENRPDLCLDWTEFSGKRNVPDAKVWNKGVVDQLKEVKDFIIKHRSTRYVSITGTRRLSAALAIGSVFSATSGFTVAMEHRDGTWWNTGDHAGAEDALTLYITLPKGTGDLLAVSLGIPNDISAAVQNYLQDQAADIPCLHITFPQPITSSRQVNAIVGQAKHLVLQSLAQTRAKEIALFCAVPSYVALFLGHRLNATAPVYCFEYVGPNQYRPTCSIAQ